MIELHKIEDSISYAVVDDFLFSRYLKNSNTIVSTTSQFIKFSYQLIDCVKYIFDEKSKYIKMTIVKFQDTDKEIFKVVLKLYTQDEISKYFLLL